MYDCFFRHSSPSAMPRNRHNLQSILLQWINTVCCYNNRSETFLQFNSSYLKIKNFSFVKMFITSAASHRTCIKDNKHWSITSRTQRSQKGPLTSLSQFNNSKGNTHAGTLRFRRRVFSCSYGHGGSSCSLRLRIYAQFPMFPGAEITPQQNGKKAWRKIHTKKSTTHTVANYAVACNDLTVTTSWPLTGNQAPLVPTVIFIFYVNKHEPSVCVMLYATADRGFEKWVNRLLRHRSFGFIRIQNWEPVPKQLVEY